MVLNPTGPGQTKAFALQSSCMRTEHHVVLARTIKLSLVKVLTAQTVCFSHAACNDQLQPPNVTARCHQGDIVMACWVAGHRQAAF